MAQACSLPSSWLERTQRGYEASRSGHISLIPRTPAYMASGAGGWSHSGPWDYLQRVPLLFYGPGLLRRTGSSDRAVDLADVAPTLAAMVGISIPGVEGKALPEVIAARAPRLVVTVVWDGGGWNTLDLWPSSWPTLAKMSARGVSFTQATVGSSPSVTPAVHSTLGTGTFPRSHGITGVPVLDDDGQVTDSFLMGASARFLERRTLAEIWDEHEDGDALVGMVGYEPWHLGMIGAGAEIAGGDRDHAAWLDVDNNEWITNPDHYSLPPSLVSTPGLRADLDDLDRSDGAVDGMWLGHEVIDDVTRIEETPAFIRYHTRGMLRMIAAEGYGEDRVTDLLFTNYKQIDRVGHYFNMAAPEVRAVLEETDARLGTLTEGLDELVGRGEWLLVLTADHGQQPDAAAVGGYGIDPRELEDDIDAEFGPVTQAAWPTEIFLKDGGRADDVAAWLEGYTLGDNRDPDGVSEMPDDTRLFELAIPSRLLPEIACPG